jgi:hypothetical protein
MCKRGSACVVVVVVVVVDAGSLLMVWLVGIVLLTLTISSLLSEEGCYLVVQFRVPPTLQVRVRVRNACFILLCLASSKANVSSLGVNEKSST